VVGQLQARLDRTAGRGIPAHVTILYPFVPPGQITAAMLGKATDAAACVPGFDCQFAGTGWFGDQVVWLAPEPASPFWALTAACANTSAAAASSSPRGPPGGPVASIPSVHQARSSAQTSVSSTSHPASAPGTGRLGCPPAVGNRRTSLPTGRQPDASAPPRRVALFSAARGRRSPLGVVRFPAGHGC
jgi:hypothetical protein